MITNPTHVLLGTTYDKSLPVSWFETKLGRQAVDPNATPPSFCSKVVPRKPYKRTFYDKIRGFALMLG
ncbi:MAG: hypothetical protein EBT51_07470 [Flavobacteriaceae bacterium]|nr:hypothetical protein [Flavobacteriaceae bacterium]